MPRPTLATAGLIASLVVAVGAPVAWVVGRPQDHTSSVLATPTAGTRPEASPTPVPSPPTGAGGPSTPLAAEVPDVPVSAATLPPAALPAPVRLVFPRLRLDQQVLPMGVRTDGQMDLPEKPTDFGWYEYGATPGDQSGSSVIGAHVDSLKYGVGPMSRLRSAKAGDSFRVTLADGRSLAYTVQAVQLLPRRTLPVDELFRADGAPVLRLATCGGSYSKETGYSDNVVVTAVPVGSP